MPYINSSVFISMKDSDKHYLGINKRGKSDHTIQNIGKTETIFIGLDVDTLVVFTENIDLVSIPGLDLLEYEPKEDKVENNFVIKQVNSNVLLDDTFVVGHVITESGAKYSLKFVFVSTKHANHNVYILDSKEKLETRFERLKEGFEKKEKKLRKELSLSHSILSPLLYDNGVPIKESVSYSNTTISLKSIYQHDEKIIFNFETSNREKTPSSNTDILINYTENKKFSFMSSESKLKTTVHALDISIVSYTDSGNQNRFSVISDIKSKVSGVSYFIKLGEFFSFSGEVVFSEKDKSKEEFPSF